MAKRKTKTRKPRVTLRAVADAVAALQFQLDTLKTTPAKPVEAYNPDREAPWTTGMGERTTLGRMELAHLASSYALLLRKARQEDMLATEPGDAPLISSDADLVEAAEEKFNVAAAMRRELMRRLAEAAG